MPMISGYIFYAHIGISKKNWKEIKHFDFYELSILEEVYEDGFDDRIDIEFYRENIGKN